MNELSELRAEVKRLSDKVEDLEYRNRDLIAIINPDDFDLSYLGPLFTTSESVILNLLRECKYVCTKERLFNALYWDRSDPLDIKIIDVFISKIRKKLRELSVPGSIETVWGRGYLCDPILRDYLNERRINAANGGTTGHSPSRGQDPGQSPDLSSGGRGQDNHFGIDRKGPDIDPDPVSRF